MKEKLILLLLFTSFSFASEICEIDSKKLLKQLISTHPSIKMSKQIIEASKQNLDTAYWNFFPTPSVDVSAKNGNSYTTVARLEQPLWTGGKLTSKYDIEKSKEQESLLKLKEESFNLIENYLTIIESYAQASLNIKELEEGLQNLQELEQMLDRRIKSGISSTSDKELLNSRVEQTKSDLVLAKNRYITSLMQLELLLDEKIICKIKIKQIKVKKNKNLEEIIQKVLAFHPSIQKADIKIQTAKHEVEATKASIMPTLSLNTEYRKDSLYNDNSSGQSSVYLSFKANTGAGLSALSKVKASKIKIEELKFKKQATQKKILDSVLKDFNNYEVSKNRISKLKSSVLSSRNVLSSYKRLFVAGKKQWLNLLDASRELMNHKIKLANANTNKNILAYKLALKNGQIDLLNGEINDL